MVVKKIFKENVPIEVYDEQSDEYYKSIIQEVGSGTLAIGIPMKGQDQLLMREKKSYALRLTVDDGLYSFSTRVKGRARSGNVSLFVLEWPEEVKRSQRRQFFRLTLSAEADYWLLQKGESSDAAAKEEKPGGDGESGEPEVPEINLNLPLNKLVHSLGDPEKGLIINVSGGGVCLVVNHFIPEDSLLAMRLYLQGKVGRKTVLNKGRVVRSVSIEQGKGVIRYRLGITFEGMTEKARDDLINFIFTLSREKAQ